jgi:hypothetical protein
MQTALRILTHTPVWVFVLLTYLIWQGLQALQPRTQAVWRMLIVPLVFFGMGLSRLVLARDAPLMPLLAWFAALTLFTVLGFFNGPRHLAVDRQKGTVTRPGSVGPLLRNITVFTLQYGVAVATAMKLEPHAAVAIIGHAVSGASAGYFSGWAIALWRAYRNSDGGQNAGSSNRS